MTSGNSYLLVLVVVYLVAFFARNLKTYRATKTPIRGSSFKLTLSILLSSIIYLVVILQIIVPEFQHYFWRLILLQVSWVTVCGYVLVSSALLIGLAALYEMKNSWRVGILQNQKTQLITTGIFAFSRNPYFLSYDLLFVGTFLVFPSVILLLLISALFITFHSMIHDEEEYLVRVHGAAYTEYKRSTGRYIPGC